jgi:hypothetical protein
LNAVITISKVVHRLKLFVDNSDAGFVGSACDLLDICGRFSLVGKLLVDSLGGFDCSLGGKFSCEGVRNASIDRGWTYLGMKP